MFAILTAAPDSSSEAELVQRPSIVFIVNPTGGNFRTRREWEKLAPQLRAELGHEYQINEVFTAGPSHATQIARKAVEDGAAKVVAVGGDGTLHEVVNGFFEAGRPVEPLQRAEGAHTRTALGVIPLGTGSDFARTIGWWTGDAKATARRIATGVRQPIDVGRIEFPDTARECYFVNIADMHLSARTGKEIAGLKRFGALCYVIAGVLAFQGFRDRDIRLRVDGGAWERFDTMTAFVVANAQFFGGGLRIAPSADVSSGDLTTVGVQKYRWYHFLLILVDLYQGTHYRKRDITVGRAKRLEVVDPHAGSRAGEEPILVEADGEAVGCLPATFSVIPGALDLLV